MNIQESLKFLNERGLSDEQIGSLIDAPQATVNRLRNGRHKSTSYERGLKITALVLNNTEAQLPTNNK